MKVVGAACLLAVSLVAHATTSVEQVPNPRKLNGWVSDGAGVIPSESETRINMTLQRLHQDTDVEVAVVTVDNTRETPKEFATALFNHWGIGDAKTNNGLLVLLVMDQRRLEMETGYGLEAPLPDAWLGDMQARVMVPKFKDGDFGAGIEAGIEEVDSRLRSGKTGFESSTTHWFPAWELVVLLLLLSIWPLVVFIRRWRQSFCPACGEKMMQLSEEADDAYLDEGQKAEERVKSVDWAVFHCEPCDHIGIFDRQALFTRFSRCPGCINRTAKVRQVTTRSPTYTSTGLAIATTRCQFCDYSSSREVVLPRKTRSSSSSSGGGSFGGGSSGGGGAGSSW